MVGVDGVGSVEEGVDEGQPEELGFGSGGDRAEQSAGVVVGDLLVQLPPPDLRLVGTAYLGPSAGFEEGVVEAPAELGEDLVFEITAVGQEVRAADAGQNEPVRESVRPAT